MRLLHVVASYLPARRYGGTIVSVHGLCRALAARGHDVHVYTTSVDGGGDSAVAHGVPVDLDGVKIWYFESRTLRRIYRSPALGRALRDGVDAFDVVPTHAIYLWPLWTAARAAQRAGVPYVVSPRGMLEKRLIENKSALLKASLIAFIEKRTLEGAAAIHVTSRRERIEAEAFGFDLRLVREIPNGVDSAPAAVAGAASPAIAAIVAGAPYVLSNGRITCKKGLDRLIRALPHAGAIRLVIAGNDEDGYRAALENIASAAGVSGRVVFAGAVHGDDKAALLGGARALVLPSYSENFGNVVVEAMAAARPVIVTPEVGVADLVERSGAGLVVDGAAVTLGTALARASAGSPECREMGARGLAAAKALSWDMVAGEMERLYEEVCA
jgi:glycosyltransferase involved in cell wall biosynthesis